MLKIVKYVYSCNNVKNEKLLLCGNKYNVPCLQLRIKCHLVSFGSRGIIIYSYDISYK